MKISLTGFVAAANGLTQLAGALPKVTDQILGEEAERFAEYMREQVGANGPPLAPNTLATGGKDPLRRTLELQQSVTASRVKKLLWFIGVPRRANRHKIAAVHEFGTVVTMRITQKQSAWMAVNLPEGPTTPGSGSGGGILVIVIPARPYVRPTFAHARQTASVRLAARFGAVLKRTFSGV